MPKAKVLVVEDVQSIAEMYAFKLENNDYDVKVALDGKEGLQVAKNWQPDLILLDLMMPVMTGEKMLEKLRQTEWGAKIRVMILTNVSRSEAPSMLRYLNVEKYIVKAHTTPSEIVQDVNKLFE